MSLVAILDKIGAVIGAVDDVGVVVVFSRYTGDEAAMKAAYVGADAILHPWIVGREATESKYITTPGSIDGHRVVLHHFRAVTAEADSERKAQIEVEAVREAIYENRNLLVEGVRVGVLKTPPSCRLFDARMFCNQVLCWHAEVAMTVEENLITV